MKIGVLGTGQLCLMMANAAKAIDITLRPCGEHNNPLLNALCEPEYFCLNDFSRLAAFLQELDVLTFETESIADEVVEFIESNDAFAKKCRPNLDALKIFQNRLKEKNYFTSLHLPTAKYRAITEAGDLEVAAQEVGFPLIIKTAQGGYDGKGQALVHNTEQLEQAWLDLQQRPCIAEQFIKFDREVSIIGARDIHGAMVFYPLISNYHRDGILRLSLVDSCSELQIAAQEIMSSIFQDLDYIGCMTIEFFVDDNKLLLNEVAPRVHNSGHWTLDSSSTSQFLLHLQAVAGLAISEPECTLPAAMYNCIGEFPKNSKDITGPTVKLYNYGKVQRPNRKLGHINFLESNFDGAFKQLIQDYINTGDEEPLLKHFR